MTSENNNLCLLRASIGRWLSAVKVGVGEQLIRSRDARSSPRSHFYQGLLSTPIIIYQRKVYSTTKPADDVVELNVDRVLCVFFMHGM